MIKAEQRDLANAVARGIWIQKGQEARRGCLGLIVFLVLVFVVAKACDSCVENVKSPSSTIEVSDGRSNTTGAAPTGEKYVQQGNNLPGPAHEKEAVDPSSDTNVASRPSPPVEELDPVAVSQYRLCLQVTTDGADKQITDLKTVLDQEAKYNPQDTATITRLTNQIIYAQQNAASELARCQRFLPPADKPTIESPANEIRDVGAPLPTRQDGVVSDAWRTAQLWISGVQSGDVQAYENCYGNRLTRYYNHANVTKQDVINSFIEVINKFPTREIKISRPSFQVLDENSVQIGFDKDYRFSGPDVKVNAGRTKSTLRMNKEPNGKWKITAEFDTEICWSTLMRDPAMQGPPGRCPAQ